VVYRGKISQLSKQKDENFMSTSEMVPNYNENCQREEHHRWFFSMMAKFDDLATEHKLMCENYLKESEESWEIMSELHRESIMREFI
jgi:hypothetical protein